MGRRQENHTANNMGGLLQQCLLSVSKFQAEYSYDTTISSRKMHIDHNDGTNFCNLGFPVNIHSTVSESKSIL